jgi:uncharacterized protein YdhG (YjbR/CyaY superfamily)
MKTKQAAAADIDDYIARFPPSVRKVLKEVRATVQGAAPRAEEAISYQIPTFKLKGNLVHFAAFKNHLGFYPTSSGVAHFKAELASYETAKGSIQFPLDRPIPHGLIRRIVKFRVKENLGRDHAKAKPRPRPTA